MHPGVVLQEEFLKPLNLTPKQFAEKLDGPWTELQVIAILKGKEGINHETARAFAAVLGTPEPFWIRLDQQYYQWEQTHHKPLKKAQ
ncbi:MAG TPA: HigA family addiction module antitoxin [Rhabdochlamydiaceae bacterium]|jgi:addiction module HigA family antidote|nr:HigA family addiction module antitoxin [Rhabdochlamydiaceae bacterium]